MVGFASVVLGNSLYLGFIGVYTRLDDTGYRLTYPTKKIGDKSINIYHPINKGASKAIELAVFKKLKEIFNN
jgi:stage V sporulation protein G